MYTYLVVFTHACLRADTHACLHVPTYVRPHVLCECMSACRTLDSLDILTLHARYVNVIHTQKICMFVCVCVCACVYTYIEREAMHVQISSGKH